MQFPVATILACLFALIASVVGQSVVILSPKDNDSIALNQTFTVQVGVPNQLTGLKEFSATVSLLRCDKEYCGSPSDGLGYLLAADKDFAPQYHEQKLPPYTNYSVTLPSFTVKGPQVIAVSRFYLLGAGLMPILEFKNVTINVV